MLKWKVLFLVLNGVNETKMLMILLHFERQRHAHVSTL